MRARSRVQHVVSMIMFVVSAPFGRRPEFAARDG
jgi:hypothetical protein